MGKKVFTDEDEEGVYIEPLLKKPKKEEDPNQKWGYQQNWKRDETRSEEGPSSREPHKSQGYFKNSKYKQWRIIIRNLPFKTSVEDLQNVCSKFGPFTEIILPPCKDKRFPQSCAGFAFIQFKTRAVAETAKKSLNEQKMHGRSIAADWALDKDSYETAKHDESEELSRKVKKEEEEDVKKETESENETDEDDEEEEEEEEEKSRKVKIENEEEESEDESEEEEEKPREDTAVTQGRVVFLRNLSYDTSNEVLKEEMAKFGTVGLALICKYPDSGHSKGTAFVHFSTVEEAKKVVESTMKGELIIDGRTISAHIAISKESARKIEKDQQTKAPKDSRNILLLRTGIIREGTAAANGMSKEDAGKRARLAEAARKKLSNLSMFVSPTRLAIHNVPFSLDDGGLRKICREATEGGGTITECRIWRNMKVLDDKNQPKSCGFGFVAFSSHSAALSCLQSLNNNPSIFTNERRPIVEFSIENLKALQMRERRNQSNTKERKEKKGIHVPLHIKQELEETTKKLRKKGMKPLPLKMTAKTRSTDKQKKKISKKNKGKKGPKRNISQSENQQSSGGAKKRPGKASSKTLAKFLGNV